MRLSDIFQAIREYPALSASLEAVQSELRQTRQALKQSEQECRVLKEQMGVQSDLVSEKEIDATVSQERDREAMAADNLLALYSPIQVDIIDGDGSGQTVPLQAVGPEHMQEYLDMIVRTLGELQTQEEARNAFVTPNQDWLKVCRKITSVTRMTALIDGKPYGVYFCRSNEALDPKDVEDLKSYCRNQWEQGWGEGYAHCPREDPSLGLYIHFWQDDGAPLLTRGQLEAVRHAGQLIPAVKTAEVTPDTFWTWIEQVKGLCALDQKAAGYWMTEQLLAMGPEQTLKFQCILEAYLELADKYGLWNAAILIRDDGCNRDAFEDFRFWLIAQGKDVYMAALHDPDSLADVPLSESCQFKSLMGVADMAYQRLSGHMAYDSIESKLLRQMEAELRQEIVYGAGIDYPHEWSEVAAYLPRLCDAHTTPEELRACARRGRLWNHDDPAIQKARAAAPKKKSKGNKKKGGDAR